MAEVKCIFGGIITQENLLLSTESTLYNGRELFVCFFFFFTTVADVKNGHDLSPFMYTC